MTTNGNTEIQAVHGELVPANHETGLAHNPTPMDLLRIAVSQGSTDLEKLAKLMDLQERFEKNEARKAFAAAMKQFKMKPPVILKNKHVHFENSAGKATDYDHATLDHACEEITKALTEVGITHAWKMKKDAELITVTCVLTHELGHTEPTELWGAPDNSGGKNAIQAISSTVSYLQRYTLLAACGLAPKNVDDDGRGGKPLSGIDPDKVEDYIRQMAEVETLADLQTVFKKAFKEASVAKDMAVLSRYTQVKDARKKELEHANG